MATTRAAIATVVFLAALTAAWLFHGSGVVRNEPERRIHIPEELTMPLQVKAAYDGERIFFRYRWPAERPHLYHDLLRYEDGGWRRVGQSTVGPQEQGIYEDRVSMMVDDGRVPDFDRYGGFVTIGRQMRFFTDQADREAVSEHPYLGKIKGKHDVRKFLPATRHNPADWATVVPPDKLAALRETGYFLDLWHWRAHRSNPIGESDDQFIAEYRYGDAGKGPYSTNWDKEAEQPEWMFDPEEVGFRALDWNAIAERRLGFDDIYYLREGTAVPFDPEYDWQEGDTIPRRLLRAPEGSRGDVSVAGEARWRDGYWNVTLVRPLDTGHPLDDKAFAHGGVYWAAMAVHRNATGSRWHYVSLPVTVGLGRSAAIEAVRFSDGSPAWQQPWHELTLFYPGQLNWPLINSDRHAGAEQVAEGVPVRARHTSEQLAHYAVEMEFNRAILRNWLWTLIAGVLLIAGFGVALVRTLRQREA